MKGKLTLSELGTPSVDHISIDQAVFKHTHIHLILSDHMFPMGVENLNKTSESFTHFHSILLHVEPNMI